MNFSSIIFLVYFLPIFMLLYHFIDRQYKNLLILGASMIFYAWGAPKFVFVVILSTIVDYYLVRYLAKQDNPKKRKQLLALSIILNLGILAFFKYANFFVENFNELLTGMGISQVGWTSIALPIGISFYVFQSISYAVDVYRKEEPPLDRLTDYMLYIFSFPQLIAGPIVRFGTVSKEIRHREEKIDDKLIGFYRFSIGLAKKAILSNLMAEQSEYIFNSDFSQLPLGTAWFGAIAYTFHIYFDFSGYSDMAIGLGKMMGFHFPENFNTPYVSKSITEFWRRWHMTLGNFMRDYLYIPLGGNRSSNNWKTYRNLWLVFFLSGLWHGASWNFIIWGCYHGLFLILERLFLKDTLKKAGSFISILFTFLITIIGWVIFKIEDVSLIDDYLYAMFNFSSSWEIWLSPMMKVIVPLCFLFSFFPLLPKGKMIQDFFYKKNTFSISQNLSLTVLSFCLIYLAYMFLAASDFNPFIYYRF